MLSLINLCHVLDPPLNYGENKLRFEERMMMSALYKTNTLSWMFIVLVH
jgi:hypothetical protein